ncbi:hypothetical protein [Streptomyces hypolithicus]
MSLLRSYSAVLRLAHVRLGPLQGLCRLLFAASASAAVPLFDGSQREDGRNRADHGQHRCPGRHSATARGKRPAAQPREPGTGGRRPGQLRYRRAGGGRGEGSHRAIGAYPDTGTDECADCQRADSSRHGTFAQPPKLDAHLAADGWHLDRGQFDQIDALETLKDVTEGDEGLVVERLPGLLLGGVLCGGLSSA